MLHSISALESQVRSRALTSAQIRAARSLIRWTADELAAASALSVATIRRALETAGVEFIDENGGGPGVRLRKRHQKKA